jgi:hypothetical protein
MKNGNIFFLNQTKNKQKLLFLLIFYKSEKSEGISSIDVPEEPQERVAFFFQNTLFQIYSIFSKILFGCAYFSTSSQSKFPSIGKKNIVKTVTTIHIIAYLIVLIAGFILSSFPQESIRSNPHRRINIIEKTHDTKTKREIAVRIKSQSSKDCQSIELDLESSKA